MLSRKTRRRIKAAFIALVFLIYVAAVLFPLYWVLLTSLRTEGDIFGRTDRLVPKNLTIKNYTYLFTKKSMDLWLRNSLLTSLICTMISLLVAVPAAYSLARLKYRGAQTIAKAVLFMYLLPQALLYIPLYVMLSKLGLLDNLASLFLAYPTFTLPFCTWLLLGYFKTIPEELEDAARIDGCSRIQVLLRVVLPLATPGVVTAAIFSMASAWNEYLYALIFLFKDNLKTVQVGLAALRIGDTIRWGPMMAGAVIATLPPVLLYMFLQRYIVEGLTAGAVKE